MRHIIGHNYSHQSGFYIYASDYSCSLLSDENSLDQGPSEDADWSQEGGDENPANNISHFCVLIIGWLQEIISAVCNVGHVASPY